MEAIVICRGLGKRYGAGDTAVHALQDVDLEIHRGEFLSLSGPSGSGKTTLLNHIGGLDRPSSGEVSVDGRKLGELDKGQLADLRLEKIGFVFQARRGPTARSKPEAGRQECSHCRSCRIRCGNTRRSH